MSIEQNKAVVRSLMKNFTPHDLDKALDLLAEDAVWTMMGQPRRFPYAGAKNKTDTAAQLQGFLSLMAKFSWEPKVMTAEDDRVAVEAVSYGEMADGKKYSNVYHMLFTLRDGKIVKVSEYLDPLEVLEFTGAMTFPA
jgi:ketosteroid isomerase-like protein